MRSSNGSGTAEWPAAEVTSTSPSQMAPDGQHVGRLDVRVESHVVVLTPRKALAGDLVVHDDAVVQGEAEGSEVQVDRRLPCAMRIEVDDDDHRVLTLALGVAHDLVAVGRVEREV